MPSPLLRSELEVMFSSRADRDRAEVAAFERFPLARGFDGNRMPGLIRQANSQYRFRHGGEDMRRLQSDLRISSRRLT